MARRRIRRKIYPISLITIVTTMLCLLSAGVRSADAADLLRRRLHVAETRLTSPRSRLNQFRPISTLLKSKRALGVRGGSMTSVTRPPSNKIVSKTMIKATGGGGGSPAELQVQQPDIGNDKEIRLLIRILFLCYYASLGSLMPYLPVYYQSLGHAGSVIGLLGAVKPLTTFLVAPMWGILSDRSPSKFPVLYFTFTLSLVGQLLVAASPKIWFLMGAVFVTAIFNAPVKSLMDSIVMDNLQDKSSYGRMRLWGQLGFGLGSSGVGFLLSRSKQVTEGEGIGRHSIEGLPERLDDVVQKLYVVWMNITGYRLLFLTYAALSVPTWLIMKAFERRETAKRRSLREAATATDKSGDASGTQAQDDDNNGSKTMEGLRLLLHNSDALLFFFLVFVVGTSSGVIENFAYVRLREVGGTGKEMGLSRLVSSAAGAPMFYWSRPLTERLGVDKVLVMALFSYVTRFFLYASMKHPFHGLPAEALRGVTFAAFWSTSTIYAHKISPPGLSSTMLMFVNAMYGGLGQSLGAIVGGKMQSKFGTVKTFIYSAIFDLIFVGVVILYLSLRTNSSFRNPQPIGAVVTEGEKQSSTSDDEDKKTR